MSVRWRFKSRQLAFTIIVLLYFIPKYLEYTTFANIEIVSLIISGIKLISYALAMIYFAIKFIDSKRTSCVFLYIVVPLLVYFFYQLAFLDRNTIFVVVLFSLLFKEKNMKQYVDVLLYTSIILYLTTIISCKIGLIENVVTERSKFGDVWEYGGQGFIYSGQMIMMLIPIVFLYYYKYDGKIKWWNNLIWIGITVWVYLQCRTIMGTVLILMFIFLYNIMMRIKGVKRFFTTSKFIKISPCFFATLSLVFVWLYSKGTSWGNMLDVIVNGRLSVSYRVIQRYGINLLGTEFVNNTLDGKYEILDSEYISMLVSGGIIYLMVAIFVCVCIMKYAQRQSAALSLIWFMIFFNAIFNNGIFGLVMNPFSILVVPAVQNFCKHSRVQNIYGESMI